MPDHTRKNGNRAIEVRVNADGGSISLREFMRAFYEAALEDEMTWSTDEAWSLAKIAMRDFFRRNPDAVNFA